MSQPPIPPPGQPSAQPYGQQQPGQAGPPPHPYGQPQPSPQAPYSQQPAPYTQHPVPQPATGGSAPGGASFGSASADAAGPGALALALLLGGYVLLTVPALLVPILSVTGPAVPSAVWISFFSIGLGVVARLIGIAGILTVRGASWARRGIAAGILAATALAYYLGQFLLQLVIQQMVGASTPPSSSARCRWSAPRRWDSSRPRRGSWRGCSSAAHRCPHGPSPCRSRSSCPSSSPRSSASS